MHRANRACAFLVVVDKLPILGTVTGARSPIPLRARAEAAQTGAKYGFRHSVAGSATGTVGTTGAC
jgi:hypothetical protein